MNGRLIDAVRGIVHDVIADDMADAVWLLDQVNQRLAEPGGVAEPSGERADGAPSSASSDSSAPHTPSGSERSRPSVADPPEPSGPDTNVSPNARSGRDSPPVPSAPTGVAEWFLPTSGRLLEQPSRVPLRSPGVYALPGALTLARALRPLRRRRASRTAKVLDEEATVRMAVDCDLWIPVQRPSPGRWLELALVVDDSTSMVIWRKMITEVRQLFERLGAFRDIRIWHCDTDFSRGRLLLRPEGEPAGGGRQVRELVDPTGARVVLVITDCVGAAWGNGEMSRALEAWGSAGPVAIAHTLPQRLWPACAASFTSVRLSSRRPGAPNSALGVAVVDQWADRPTGVPVPVLELEARWFARWAALVAGTGSEWVSGTAVFTGTARDPGPGGPAPGNAAGDLAAGGPEGFGSPVDVWTEPDGAAVLGPDELIERYTGFASTEAVRLATYLAGAPLNLPVMRLVQQTMLPSSRPSVLAEVFLGGLLRPVDGPARRRRDPDEIEYDFVPGVRDRLLAGLSRQDRLTVLTRVSDFVSTRLGSPMEFRAFLSAAQSATDVLRKDPPFARVALHVLHDMGGRYREAANRLRGRSFRLPTDSFGDVVEMANLSGNQTRRTPDSSDNSVLAATVASVDSGDPVLVSPASSSLPGTSPDGRTDTPAEVRQQPSIFSGVPFRNPHFTGRRDSLERLHTMLQYGTRHAALLPHALHGMGGVGKTQLAVEYAYRYASEYDLVWWVPAESPTTVRSSLVQLAEVIGLPRSDDVSQTITNVLANLRAGTPYSRWLLVFDNADQPEGLHEYLPVPRGHVLVTSRNPQWADVATQLEVDVFTRAESVILLQRRSGGVSAEEADVLAEKLGDLPLALDHAAAWLSETGSPVPELVRLLDERMRDLLADRRSTVYPLAVMATWDLSFNRLREQAPGAAQLLELCAFFGSEPIPISLLREGRYAEIPDAVARVLRDDILLRRAIRELGRFALAKLDPSRDRIEIHRLVQAVLREQMTPEGRDAARDAVHRILGTANPGSPDDQRTWGRHADLLPHISLSGLIDAKDESGRRAVLDQIRYRFVRGDYERSRILAETAVDRWRETLGPRHEMTLVAQRYLAIALREAGEWSSAAELNQETLALTTATFGAEHEHTISIANSVGADYRLRGEFQQARTSDEETLRRHRRLFADDDPETLRARNNLAVDLRLLGDFRGALELDRSVHEARFRTLGAENAETFLSLVSLAHDHVYTGQFAEANALLGDVLPRIRERLGDNHRITLLAARVLVIVLRRLGAVGRARELAEELYLTARQRYRPDHERVLSASLTYANALLAVGEHRPARSLAEQAYHLYGQSFGTEHPFTLAAAVDLAVVLRVGEEYRPAYDLDEPTLGALRRLLGDDHPHTLVAMLNLSNDCAAIHDHERGRALSKEAWDRSNVVRGAVHPDTLICGLNHALDLLTAGDSSAARELSDRVRPALRRTFGEDHPISRAAADGGRISADIEVPAV